jgi:hypothetical protein
MNMKVTFDITTSRDFLAKLEADFADYMKEPDSARLALNCAITAYHLHDWVWGDWLKKNGTVRKTLGICDKESFLAWIDKTCPEFPAIQTLTNGTKHFAHNQKLEASRVGAPPLIFDDPYAGLDVGAFDGPIPYVAESHGKGYLLIDYGPAASEHRWVPAQSLLEAVMRFWRAFFERHAPL